jgi:hypothetical protein
MADLKRVGWGRRGQTTNTLGCEVKKVVSYFHKISDARSKENFKIYFTPRKLGGSGAVPCKK